MRLTGEQREAVRCDENLMLTACPGSGKTRVIISRLARVLDEVRATPRSVACITYTNTAVYEIEERLRHHIQPGDDAYYDICTIHSFCLNYIFRPFCYLIKGYSDGFKVLTPESADFDTMVRATLSEAGIGNPTFRDFDDFSQLRMNSDGKPVGIALQRGVLTDKMARSYWARIRGRGFIDFANIIYYSLLLLSRRPEILGHIAAKFAYILVDEFQDTTDLQVEILSRIADLGLTKFLLVGDPAQSIFGFAGARPDLADAFAAHIGARTDIQLTGNFRSSRLIVADANRLLPRAPTMEAVGRNRDAPDQTTWRHGNTAFQVIVDHFLPTLESLGIPQGDAAILAPSWYSLFPLGRQLRDYGVSIVGPGARPYRRNRLFAPLAEQVCAQIIVPRPEAIGSVERALYNTILDASGRAHFEVFSYAGRAVVYRLLHKAEELYATREGAIDWLEAAAEAFSDILVSEALLAESEEGLLRMSVEEMKVDIRNNKVDAANLTIDDLGMHANPETSLKLTTLHNSKGREYAAVAMVDMHEGKIPFYQARSDDEIAEARRLFYVGVTRAERILMYATDKRDHRNVPSRFLEEAIGRGSPDVHDI